MSNASVLALFVTSSSLVYGMSKSKPALARAPHTPTAPELRAIKGKQTQRIMEDAVRGPAVPRMTKEQIEKAKRGNFA